MSDPTDAELLEFVARFVGWTDLEPREQAHEALFGINPAKGLKDLVPNYVESVDAWLSDVWPKVAEIGWPLEDRWDDEIKELVGGSTWKANATARQRCLALYRALDGKLPPATTKDGAA